jgi:hypothetical protein
LLSQILVVAVAVVATAVVIQVQPAAESAPAPVIAAAQPNSDTQTLTIQGVNFGDALSEVTLGLSPLTVSSWTSTSVTASLPAYAPGSYLLVLKRADGIFSNSMDLTIGAVGPMGPAGPQGPVARSTDTLLGFGGGAGDLGLGAGEGADTVTRGTFAREFNTAYGYLALENVVENEPANTGVHNAALGRRALQNLTMGRANLGIGTAALREATTAIDNAAIGSNALQFTLTGERNVAIGSFSLQRNMGSDNVAIGDRAGIANMNGSNNIYVGSPGDAADSGTIRIGRDMIHTATYIEGKIHGDGSGLTGVTAVYQ